MGANNSHIAGRRSSRPSTARRTTPSTPATTYTASAPSTAHGSPATTYTTPSPTYYSAPSDERTSISCEPSTSPISSRNNVPLRIGYPYYEEVAALEARRGSRRRSKSLSKVLENIGFTSGGH